ncbi:hypothetical protein KW787_01720 [Candidatus Pacearchaeota archaeon]|nr:hypothetical protein [Candidatus Pacearchaeota archaeon]
MVINKKKTGEDLDRVVVMWLVSQDSHIWLGHHKERNMVCPLGEHVRYGGEGVERALERGIREEAPGIVALLSKPFDIPSVEKYIADKRVYNVANTIHTLKTKYKPRLVKELGKYVGERRFEILAAEALSQELSIKIDPKNIEETMGHLERLALDYKMGSKEKHIRGFRRDHMNENGKDVTYDHYILESQEGTSIIIKNDEYYGGNWVSKKDLENTNPVLTYTIENEIRNVPIVPYVKQLSLEVLNEHPRLEAEKREMLEHYARSRGYSQNDISFLTKKIVVGSPIPEPSKTKILRYTPGRIFVNEKGKQYSNKGKYNGDELSITKRYNASNPERIAS